MNPERLARAIKMHREHCIKHGVEPKEFSLLPESTKRMLKARAARAIKAERSSLTIPPDSVRCGAWVGAGDALLNALENSQGRIGCGNCDGGVCPKCEETYRNGEKAAAAWIALRKAPTEKLRDDDEQTAKGN